MIENQTNADSNNIPTPEIKKPTIVPSVNLLISIDDFKKCELVIGQIKDVQDHTNADKLYVVKVDLGGEERQLVAGIRSFYAKEQLIGRQVIIVKNLQPATIRGVESQGMILAVKDSEGLSLLTPDRKVSLGHRVS